MKKMKRCEYGPRGGFDKHASLTREAEESVTKIIVIFVITLVPLKSDLDLQQTGLRSLFMICLWTNDRILKQKMNYTIKQFYKTYLLLL